MQDNWLPSPEDHLDPVVKKFFGIREPGTIHLGILDGDANLALWKGAQ